MPDPRHSISWQSWLKLGRLIPLLTIAAATAVGISSFLGHFQVSIAEGVIIAPASLLAVES